MGALRVLGAVAALSLMISAGARAQEAGPQASGAWAERVQVLYQEQDRSVLRKRVRIWDPHPEKNLDFVWEPARDAGDGVAADGTISGMGKLVWRVRGSARYDPRTIYSVYSGEIRDGRPDGQGRLEIRSGEVFEGHWREGVLDGKGVHLDAVGDRYEGLFSGGLPNGEGRLLSATGEIFTGRFVDGLKHGRGRTLLPGGTAYESEWNRGRELGGARPDVLADAGVGGLLRAQAGGGDAGKVEISTAVDQRMTQQSDMQYEHLLREEDIAIYPVDRQMNDAWNGTGLISNSSYIYDGIDWEYAPAFVEIGLATSDGSRVKLDKLELQVSSSEAYRKPMLSLQGHVGCVGFRPTFSFLNHGWGDVRDASMTVQFSHADAPDAASRSYQRSIADFDTGIDVTIADVLQEAGVDTQALTTERFQCQSQDALNVCRSQVFNKVGFGEIADFVWGEDKLFTTAKGTLNYSWADDQGTVYQASEPFQVDIALATIELPEPLAECGDGFGGTPEALRYQDIRLPVGQRDYVVALAFRGNRNIRDHMARLKMSAEMSSFHQFQTVAKFADGSERRSKPVSLFYFRPRPSTFQTAMQPAACYLGEDYNGC